MVEPEVQHGGGAPGGVPPRLRVIVDHEVVRDAVVSGPVTLGRLPDNGVVLEDDRVSGHHGRIEVRDGRWRYTDLGSRNGSLVAAGPRLGEGESFDMTELTQIRLGRTVVEFRPGAGAEPSGGAGEASTGTGAELRGREEGPPVDTGSELRGGVGPSAASGPERGGEDEPAADAFAATPPLAPAPSSPREASVASAPGGDSVRAPASSAAGSSARPAHPRLVVVYDERVETVAVPGGVAVIGRADACEVVVSHPSVSARHAELRFAEGRWELRDLGSTNGTRVGLKRVHGWRPLVNGSHVIVGAVDGLFLHDGPYPSERERPQTAQSFVRWLREHRLLTRAQAADVITACAGGEHVWEALVRRRLFGPGELTELRHEAALSATEDRARPRRGLWILAALVATVVLTWVLSR